MIRIVVQSVAVREMSGTSQRTGKPYSMKIQQAYAWPLDADGNPPLYPEKFEIVLGRERPEPYPKGEYTLHPSAIYVDGRGNLAVSPRLTPRAAAAPAAAPAVAAR